MSLAKEKYDAIIIGAGISGLVCGCYLTKAGMKTLIVEKNAKPGGCCTSFKRGGFAFDACVHSLGSFREGGILRTILRELDLEHRIEIKRHDPSDIIITPDFKIHFWNDLQKTIKEFQDNFPKESEKIEEFFNYLNNYGLRAFIDLKSITFKDLLDKYFKDNKLKAILSLPLLGNAGLPASKISAIVGAFIYKEFMFDGGYYPNGSIQSLPDILVKCFKELGGDTIFSSFTERITTENNKVEGIEIAKKGRFTSKYVISNADTFQTFNVLMSNDSLVKSTSDKLKNMEPSLSAFVLYLGTDGKLSGIPENTGLWYLPHYDVEELYTLTVNGNIDDVEWFLYRLSPDKKSLYMFINAPFKNKEYWKTNKKRFIDIFVNKMEKVVPGVSSHIIYKDAATPSTLNRWTLNHEGAAYGWAWKPSQLAVSEFLPETAVENLYLTGHWTTLAQGVAGVAYVGRDTSKKIFANQN